MESIMRSKFLAGAAALAVIAGVVMASSTPAAARWHRAWGPVAGAGAVAGAALGGVAAATSPWWGGYYGNYPYSYPYGYSGTYAYAPGYNYNYGYATPAWGFGESTNGYAQPEWNGTYGYGVPRDQAWCESHYRSYNPATGMFLGYDGRYHACP
jgi:hypothetical protein